MNEPTNTTAQARKQPDPPSNGNDVRPATPASRETEGKSFRNSSKDELPSR